MGSWIAGLLGAETAAALAIMAVVLMAYVTTKVHLESKQNASEASPQTNQLGSAKRVRAWDDTATTPVLLEDRSVGGQT